MTAMSVIRAVLIILAALILLVLFFPVRYRLSGDLRVDKGSSEARFAAKACFLFGLVRACYDYPEQPELVVKLLSLTVYRSGSKEEGGEAAPEEKRPEKSVKERIRKACDTIKRLCGKGKRLSEILDSREAAGAWERTKRVLRRVLAVIAPRKWSICGSAGLGDPAATGELMMCEAVLYPWTGKHLSVAPDFEGEETAVDLSGEAKGAAMIAVLLLAALRILLSRDVRFVWNRLRTEVING